MARKWQERKAAVREEVIRRVCEEFKVSREELMELGREKENVLNLMAVSLEREFLGCPPSRRFKKYLKFIPGLRGRYEALKKELQKKLVDFDA